MNLYRVVDRDGEALEGVGPKAKHFYMRDQDARGVATQYNNIVVMRNGEAVQLPGAPFTVKKFVAKAV